MGHGYVDHVASTMGERENDSRVIVKEVAVEEYMAESKMESRVVLGESMDHHSVDDAPAAVDESKEDIQVMLDKSTSKSKEYSRVEMDTSVV